MLNRSKDFSVIEYYYPLATVIQQAVCDGATAQTKSLFTLFGAHDILVS